MADFLLPISKGIRNELIASGYARPPQVILVPNSVDIELIQRKIGEEIPAYCVVKDSSVQTIVVAARLVSQKKIDVLIHAMKLIQNQGSARLLILGEGPERPSLERLVSELGLNHLVFFLGFQQNPWKYFACADLFVLPSRYEGFGNVIIEAMACGVPVIATDAPFGPRDIITNGENGLLVPVGDTAALASAIRMVLSDSNCRRNFIRNGMKRSLEYDASRIASVWVQVLRNLTESP
jgi:glycosyltransferase involved in cell wall biosynthesis